MGEVQSTLFQPEFNRSIHVEARPERLTNDGGAILVRELMDRSGLSQLLAAHLSDPRDEHRIKHPFSELVRTFLLLDSQGWHDQLDVSALRDDPALRLAVSDRRGDGPLRSPGTGVPEGLCSQSTLSRLLCALGTDENRAGLSEIVLGWAERLIRRRAHGIERLVVDLDSLPIEVHGHQPGSAYNGHFRATCFHPLVARLDDGPFLGARLRAGTAHTADGGLEFVLPMLRRLHAIVPQVWLRMDAGFPEPQLLSTLEAENVRYVARLRKNPVLQRLAEPHLKRPPGRPPREGRVWFHELSYQARSWEHPRRVVLVVLERADEQQHLFLDHFFLLTNAPEEFEGGRLLTFYRRRGTAEKEFGDWKNALDLKLSSTERPKSHYRERAITAPAPATDSFAANEARLLLSLLSANLLDFGARLLDRTGKARLSRIRFRQLVLKAAARGLLGGHIVTLVINAAIAPFWQAIWQNMNHLYPARGSPLPSPLPATA